MDCNYLISMIFKPDGSAEKCSSLNSREREPGNKETGKPFREISFQGLDSAEVDRDLRPTDQRSWPLLEIR